MRLLVLTIAAGAILAACERPPSADKAREWTASDHDTDEQSQASGAQGAQAPAVKGDAGAPSVVDTIWMSSCATCHGPSGHGDGPTGPMVNASDLTKEAWQASVKDADIAATITTGKGKMPKFDLPPQVVDGLVARIRTLRGR